MLREMEQKAREQVEHSINVGGNGFECVVTVWQEAISDDTVATALYALNGRRMRTEAKVSGHHRDAGELPRVLVDAMARDIAVAVLGPAFNGVRWPNRWRA